MSLYDLYLDPARKMGRNPFMGPQQSPFPWQQQAPDAGGPPQGYWNGPQFVVPGIPSLAQPTPPSFGPSQPSAPSPTASTPTPPPPLTGSGFGGDTPVGADVPDTTFSEFGGMLGDAAAGLPGRLGLGALSLFGGPVLGPAAALFGAGRMVHDQFFSEPDFDPNNFDETPTDFGFDTANEAMDIDDQDIGDAVADAAEAAADQDAMDDADEADMSDEDDNADDEFHKGGYVMGDGEVRAKLRAGEYVMTKPTVDYYGPAYFDKLNARKMPKT